MEDDGVVDEPVTFRVTVTVEGDRLIVDWTGSDPQVRGPVNATYGVTAGRGLQRGLPPHRREHPAQHAAPTGRSTSSRRPAAS